MRELILVPTYKRKWLLFSCLERIRTYCGKAEIIVFSDRASEEGKDAAEMFKAAWIQMPEHDYYGNSYSTMEAYRFAYNMGADLVYLIEDDVMVHPDFFDWHREMHREFPEIFAAMGWVFNQHAPIDKGEMFQPWFYSIGVSFSREMLKLIVEHASPLYYGDMHKYIRERFKSSPLNDPFNIMHVEQDGLIQRILDQNKSQTVSSGIAHCSHIGMGGYNRGWTTYAKFFEGIDHYEDAARKVDAFLKDPYWRISLFGRGVVERELGYHVPERKLNYTVRFDGWESDFVSEMSRANLPRRINGTEIPEHAEIMLNS
jgi:hypothetical protein